MTVILGQGAYFSEVIVKSYLTRAPFEEDEEYVRVTEQGGWTG